MASGNESRTSPDRGDDSYFAWYRKPEQILWAVCMTVMLSILIWHLYISRWQKPGLVDIESASPLNYRFVVDINTAEWPEFTVLPGISETYARRIVETRTTNGPFSTIEDLRNVPGIGQKRLDAIRDFLTIGRKPDVSVQSSGDSLRKPGG
jgi:competence ComEA-like helix-hairpin-helix protein